MAFLADIRAGKSLRKVDDSEKNDRSTLDGVKKVQTTGGPTPSGGDAGGRPGGPPPMGGGGPMGLGGLFANGMPKLRPAGGGGEPRPPLPHAPQARMAPPPVAVRPPPPPPMETRPPPPPPMAQPAAPQNYPRTRVPAPPPPPILADSNSPASFRQPAAPRPPMFGGADQRRPGFGQRGAAPITSLNNPPAPPFRPVPNGVPNAGPPPPPPPPPVMGKKPSVMAAGVHSIKSPPPPPPIPRNMSVRSQAPTMPRMPPPQRSTDMPTGVGTKTIHIANCGIPPPPPIPSDPASGGAFHSPPPPPPLGMPGPPRGHPPPPAAPQRQILVTSMATLAIQYETRFDFLKECDLPPPPQTYSGPRTYRSNKSSNLATSGRF